MDTENGKAIISKKKRENNDKRDHRETWLSHPGKSWPRHCKKVRWGLREEIQYFTKQQEKAGASGFAFVGLLQAEVLIPVNRPEERSTKGDS